MKSMRFFILWMLLFGYSITVAAQSDKQQLANTHLLDGKTDTLSNKNNTDTLLKKEAVTIPKKHNPRIATRRSAILPGWGQAYNKEYWKIPVVYGVLAIPAGLYLYNNSWYKKTKFAYEALFKASVNKDSADLPFIDPQLKGLSIASAQTYRNSFRRDRDYSILWFILAWGLQVADATVFAHLKQFDVSDDLSMQLTPTFNPQTRSPGFGLVLNLKPAPKKPFTAR